MANYQNKVYLASPFFSEGQKNRIKEVVELLKQNPTIDSEGIFIPEDHQFEAEPFGTFKWQDAVFASDMRQVHKADVVVAILDYQTEEGNPEPDSGTIFEIGAAFEHNTPVIMVQFETAHKLNLMLARSYTAFFNGKDDIQNLKKYDFNNLEQKYSTMEVF
ncbi:nucleoside 2-deoxyribosyltransferase [Lentilactobacillus curieae]|uniref:Nucleoside 2-deoxyribosyltransferase n=1 Tax=Lentilactobacillus curieae TaxID=1138822 RepID=A0A1S6QHU4_9LACO|nr:nucleoside 2-deoxyribosyltransferase [Lentilactobacillus curieae]AQW21187.1 nucleoside 2-deoxyribosyltransferase [Lentilactobacillus curieae]